MLEITCAPEVSEAYAALLDAIPDEGGAARARFAKAMQDELDREPTLPKLLPALLARWGKQPKAGQEA